jgi:serine/threonine-protein kinase
MVERVVTQLETFTQDATGEGTSGPSSSGGIAIPSGADRYQLLGEIGRGGMGTVYSVRDLSLLRISAMKVITPRLLGRPSEVERFVREARITAQLDHPNIVPVHEIGTDAHGNLFLMMKRVEGKSLKEWIAELETPAQHREEFLRMLGAYLKVCDAVAFAHSRGVIHCDLKPSNIMVGSFGQVYLMDWGLAQVLPEKAPGGAVEAESDSTGTVKRSGRPAGTPSFMSPEQAFGEPLDEKTDVFGLGALLYAILTGSPPFSGEDSEVALSKARASAVAFPAKAASLVPDGLWRAGLRAMARDKNQRHAGVVELKRDVEEAMQALPFLRTQICPPGSRVVVEGEPGDCAYVIVSGTCVAYKTKEDGARTILRRLEAGSVFGETAVLSGGVRTATVEAEDEVVVSVVSRQVLEQNLGLGTPFGAFVRALADRFRELDERVNPK